MERTLFITVVIVVVAAVGACALVQRGRLIAAEGAARALVVECALARAERTKNLTAINAWLAAEGYAHRAVALDCDGSGDPDF